MKKYRIKTFAHLFLLGCAFAPSSYAQLKVSELDYFADRFLFAERTVSGQDALNEWILIPSSGDTISTTPTSQCPSVIAGEAIPARSGEEFGNVLYSLHSTKGWGSFQLLKKTAKGFEKENFIGLYANYRQRTLANGDSSDITITDEPLHQVALNNRPKIPLASLMKRVTTTHVTGTVTETVSKLEVMKLGPSDLYDANTNSFFGTNGISTDSGEPLLRYRYWVTNGGTINPDTTHPMYSCTYKRSSDANLCLNRTLLPLDWDYRWVVHGWGQVDGVWSMSERSNYFYLKQGPDYSPANNGGQAWVYGPNLAVFTDGELAGKKILIDTPNMQDAYQMDYFALTNAQMAANSVYSLQFLDEGGAVAGEATAFYVGSIASNRNLVFTAAHNFTQRSKQAQDMLDDGQMPPNLKDSCPHARINLEKTDGTKKGVYATCKEILWCDPEHDTCLFEVNTASDGSSLINIANPLVLRDQGFTVFPAFTSGDGWDNTTLLTTLGNPWGLGVLGGIAAGFDDMARNGEPRYHAKYKRIKINAPSDFGSSGGPVYYDAYNGLLHNIPRVVGIITGGVDDGHHATVYTKVSDMFKILEKLHADDPTLYSQLNILP